MRPTQPSLLSLPTLLTLAIFASFSPAIREAAAQAPITKSKDPGQWALIYSDTLDKNRKLLADYSWQYRVEVQENGQQLYVDLLSARYGQDGRVETFRIDQELKIKQRQGLLLKAGQEAKLRETEAKIEILKKYIGDYVYMTRGQVVDFFEKAKKSEAVGYDNALRLDAESVINKGDSVTLYGDKTSAFPLFLVFSVPLDAKTGIRCEVSFRHLRQMGAFYGSKVTGEFLESGRVTGAKALTIDVESYDYVAKP
ncbi:MAG TPA: hypothetical protein PK529_06755 [Verrucomicrobiales bacterium]|mgnify:CR=1 FL=1|nr:hypothetical protein [Verrucomicrobiales bacterium]